MAPARTRAAIGVVAVVLLVAPAGVLVAPADDRPRRSHPLPTGVTVLTPSDGLGTVAGGWGDAWIDDRWRRRLLRVDGRSGRVVARVPVDGRVALGAGAGAIWALQSGGGYGRSLNGPLLKIDPATDRVTARIGLRTPAGGPVVGFGVLAGGGGVWVWGPRDLVRIDPRTDRVAWGVAVGEERGELTGMALRRRDLIATTADGHLVRFDARTGREAGAVRLPLRDPVLRGASGRHVLLSAREALAAFDPSTGRLAWRRPLGFRIGAVLEMDGLLWTHGATTNDAGDRLWAIEPGTGAVVRSVVLPAFSTVGMTSIDAALWVTTAGGQVIVLGPWVTRWLRWT
jgi:outer membrane protein assembly factor BamB